MAVLILLIVSLLFGTWALRPLKLGDGVEGICYRVYVGLSLSAILILVVGIFSFRMPQLILNFIAAGGLGVELFVYSKRSTEKKRDRAGGRVSPIEIVCAIVVTAVLLLAVWKYEPPVADIDSPEGIAFENILAPDETATMALFSLLQLLFGISSCVAIFALANRIENRRTGWIAAAILASSPVFFKGICFDRTNFSSIDLAYPGMVLTALTALAAWQDETDARRRSSWLLLSAFLVGESCANRPTHFLVGFLFLIGIAATAKENRFKCAAWFAVIAVIAAVPRVWPSDLYPLWLEPNRDWAGFLTYVWDLVMRPQRHGSNWVISPGGLVLFLGIPGIIVGGKRARQLALFAVAGMIIIYWFESIPEAMLPFFTIMMVIAAIAATRLERLRPLVYAILVVSFLFGLALDGAVLYAK